MSRGLNWLQILRLRLKPRYQETEIKAGGFNIVLADKSSFLYMYEEIFAKEIYRFESSTLTPRIIDAGANIGLATLYFKKLYPAAHLIAFEPDPQLFRLLNQNVSRHHLSDVTLIPKALAANDEQRSFIPDHADGGRLANPTETSGSFKVETARLSHYLNQPTDFVKIDIEGEELNVLKEAQNQLPLVKNLFVEYHSFVDQDQKLDELLALLHQAGFRYRIQSIPSNPTGPMDIQLNIYAFRT